MATASRIAKNAGTYSFGIVENAGRPDGYTVIPPKIIKLEETTKPGDSYFDHDFIYARLPGQTIAAPDDPGGWSECLVRGITYRTIVSTPGFPCPLTKPPRSVYRIAPTSMGLGVFATCDLHMGDYILSERPLTVTPIGMIYPGSLNIPESFTHEQRLQASLYEWEKMLEISFDRLTSEDQVAFKDLANSHTDDGSGPIMGVIRTNGFELEGLQELGQEGYFVGVGKVMSRINHSPSTDRIFDLQSFSFQLRATRDIKEGEELFISYCDLLQPASERYAHLAPYGISCNCAACTHFGDSDRRRLQLRESIKAISDDYEDWIADPLLADDHAIRVSLSWISVIEEQGLQASDVYRHHLYAIVQAYVALGDVDNAIKYGRVLGLWHLGQSGKDDTLKQMIDPEFHRRRITWGIRVCEDDS